MRLQFETKETSGAKARVNSAGFMRGLKPPPPSGSRLSAAWRALTIALLLLACAALPAAAKDAPRSFSLSTNRTFAPGESVKIQLYARNVPELEFRVYQVRDAQKFFAGLKDLHSFGVQSYSPDRADRGADLDRAAARLQGAPVVAGAALFPRPVH